MKAVIVNQNGTNQLELVEHPIPKAKEGELLIKVHTAAINRTDIVTREGKSGYLTNLILGVEVAGTIVEINGKSSFSVGDRVMGLVNGGGYAEYATMPINRAMKIPENFTFEEAAAIPEVFLTAYQTLFWIGKLQKQESVLIHAGASGVGTAAIQLAKKLCDAKVIVTAGSKRKLDFCKELGADVVINYKEQSFEEEVQKATNGFGVDVILDFIGAEYWQKNFESIKKGGRWVLIGILGGSEIEKVNLMGLMSKYIQLTGTLLTPRSDEYKAQLTKEFIENVTPYFERKEIRPIVDTMFPLEKAREAQQYMEESRNIGKIILKVNEHLS
ncbi:NAD(P)H-quinone oxidoreductase [Bacillus sporothermodurans]|uniref:NAD(P)H-quinone oxidoreductase n=1 Tax=Heyndrickxia sporothermodurans TaxID=46224 RepID=UPI00192CDCA9|nr:NAD(P)H-quinone oxidoreductase [Heyndrickxia sporothermodurans]MBL5801535.1 NAD(P)H-quinone oxidoreductase [Heyndrickxia sporothermodurans]MBL5812635.1 NAD(P)H-quinone oxidoreductase [Heyndrickxia sporothermodurans]MBL5816058.1 NAD(P)H-quinone oxidoreductase [Heyndrickxia sporothermodurans]MBL5819513.1 NAD(P)H-quinone oxidoreductase [Heyndrickxia sporothermodurans]MBL5844621.1 NAD(P)H-quinone oxidoreductase [Heyndrickxia sporothermodurans]